MKNQVTLYIAEHNQTGLKYFGKTESYFTKESLQKYYHGSGKYWKNHLKKHGNDVTMSIYGIFSLDENDLDYVKPIALKFSQENNIVESNEWANLISEIGVKNIDEDFEKIRRQKISKTTKGRKGKPISEETKRKISQKLKGRMLPEETKERMRVANLGKKLSKEHKQKMSDAAKGKSKSEAHLEKIRAIANKEYKCPHCGKDGKGNGMKRWHFDNCKMK